MVKEVGSPKLLFENLDLTQIFPILWRSMLRWIDPPDVLTVKDRIYVEGREWKRIISNRLMAAESFNGRIKNRLAYGRLTWQGLGNVSVHVIILLMVV